MTNYDYVSRQTRRYLPIVPGSVYETQVQSIVERNLQSLFPEYLGHRYEPYFRTAAGDVRPDIVLVRRDGTGWAVVEVEAENHSWSAHILPQVMKLKFARGDERIVAEFRQRYGSYLSENDLAQAISQRPLVFLIVHGTSSKHRSQLDEIGVQHIDIDVTYSAPNDYILVVRDRTTSYREVSGTLRRSSDGLTRNIWILRANVADLPMPQNGRLLVEVDGTASIWHVTVMSDGFLLRHPRGLDEMLTFDAGRIYVNDETHSLMIER